MELYYYRTSKTNPNHSFDEVGENVLIYPKSFSRNHRVSIADDARMNGVLLTMCGYIDENFKDGESRFIQYKNENYSAFSIRGSLGDYREKDRGLSIFFVEGIIDEKEMIELIKSKKVAMEIINRLNCMLDCFILKGELRVFVYDSDGHKYLVKAVDRDLFHDWVKMGEAAEWEGPDFNYNRVDGEELYFGSIYDKGGRLI